MKELITKGEFINALRLDKYKIIADPLMSLIGINGINKLYSDNAHVHGVDFIKAIFDQLNIKIEINLKELERLPKTGAFISVSNHPFGGIDGLALLLLLSTVRDDSKLMANFILQKIPTLKDSFFSVNPLENHKAASSSLGGMKQAMLHLKEGAPVGIFPAGEVSTFQFKEKKICDRPWLRSAVKFIKRSEVPVVPIYFQGSNSLLFHLMGLVHPSLRTASLASELLKKKNNTIKIRIGNPISTKEQANYEDIESYDKFLRMKTYSLGFGIKSESSVSLSSFFSSSMNKEVEKVAPAVETSLLESEVDAIKDKLILEKENFEIYVCKSSLIPNTVKEIGRLREETFRSIGEGTNKATDLDKFDNNYYHLFAWEKDKKEVVGAYRVGLGKEILEVEGQEGFYTNTLFKMSEEFNTILENSVELGRSFVREKYQKNRLPLLLLWNGLFKFFEAQEHDYKYFIGPVSISNKYSSYSKSLIAAFIKKHHFNKNVAKMIKPRKAYKFNSEDEITQAILETTQNDLKKLDKYIQDIDPSHFRIPVLLKKYIYQSGKIIGFNVDPKFNNCLDGFIILDYDELTNKKELKIKENMNKSIEENSKK